MRHVGTVLFIVALAVGFLLTGYAFRTPTVKPKGARYVYPKIRRRCLCSRFFPIIKRRRS